MLCCNDNKNINRSSHLATAVVSGQRSFRSFSAVPAAFRFGGFLVGRPASCSSRWYTLVRRRCLSSRVCLCICLIGWTVLNQWSKQSDDEWWQWDPVVSVSDYHTHRLTVILVVIAAILAAVIRIMVVHFYLTVSQPVNCARRPTRQMAGPKGLLIWPVGDSAVKLCTYVHC